MTHNFVLLLRVEGWSPLSLGGRRGFGLGLGPLCGTLARGAPCCSVKMEVCQTGLYQSRRCSWKMLLWSY